MADVIIASTMRELIREINTRGIKKTDIIYIGKEDGEYLLAYYKK